ncbi:putative sporulation transcription regulator WhiA [compost metagenome]
MLYFEQIRVEKEVKNNINRSINCETANLVKTISTAVKQISAIEKIKKNGKFKDLDDRLKYIAELRIKNKEASLDDLSKLTSGKNKLSKSGIKHRLDKLIEIAKEPGE